MIWVEILSRHHEIAARFRVAGSEARIGRGYDNDVIVDDPYVAAQHLRVFRDEAGQLVAEDMGSTNGTFLNGGKSRLARIVIDGKNPIRIGQTFLRVREPNHEVERERVVRSDRPTLAIVSVGALGLAILGIGALNVWLTETSEPRMSSYLTPLLTLAATVLAWVGGWALMSRLFSGASRFLRNLLVALTGVFALMLYDEFARFAGFAWTLPGAFAYQYVAMWSVAAITCFFHLREVGRGRLLLKAAVVSALLAAAITVHTLRLSEAFSESGRQNTVRLLMPPALRGVPLRDKSAFFGEIAAIKAKLDGDRTQTKPYEAGQ